jgi:hypothetical protein
MQSRYVWTYDQLGRQANETYLAGEFGSSGQKFRTSSFEYIESWIMLAKRRVYLLHPDGVIEEVETYSDRFTYRFDNNGNTTRIDRDDRDDGDVDDIQEYIYRHDGQLAMDKHDRYADRDIDSIRTYTYDESGSLSEVVEIRYRYPSFSGMRDRHKYTSTYDKNGCLVLTEFDRDYDYYVDDRTVYTCDEHANVITQGGGYCSTDTGGLICKMTHLEWEYSYDYDQRANILRKERRTSDGTIDLTENFAYDDHNNMIMRDRYSCFLE